MILVIDKMRTVGACSKLSSSRDKEYVSHNMGREKNCLNSVFYLLSYTDICHRTIKTSVL